MSPLRPMLRRPFVLGPPPASSAVQTAQGSCWAAVSRPRVSVCLRAPWNAWMFCSSPLRGPTEPSLLQTFLRNPGRPVAQLLYTFNVFCFKIFKRTIYFFTRICRTGCFYKMLFFFLHNIFSEEGLCGFYQPLSAL